MKFFLIIISGLSIYFLSCDGLNNDSGIGISTSGEPASLTPEQDSRVDSLSNADGVSVPYAGSVEEISKKIAVEEDKHELAQLYLDRGREEKSLGHLNNALSDFDRSISLYNGLRSSYFSRAMLRLEMKDFEGVLRDCNTLIEKGWGDRTIYEMKGEAKAGLKDFRGAITEYNIAIEDKDYPRIVKCYTYYLRGVARHELGDNNGACSDWSTSGDIEPSQKAYEMIKKYCN